MQNYIARSIESKIRERLLGAPRKLIILYGPRQVGKTTLVEHILHQIPDKRIKRLNADSTPITDILSSRNPEKLRLYLSDADILFIDEAQRIPEIGLNLKIIHDQLPELRVLITGSSSLDLANLTEEPLTGRTWSCKLYPFSAQELAAHFGIAEYDLRLEEWLVFGSYPETLLWSSSHEKARSLIELSSAYLYKDVLELANIRHSSKIRDLLKLLSFQIGSEVSYHELALKTGLNTQTVERYINLLEKAFVLKVVGGFSRNLRKEISRKKKIYFYDLGIRNALINRFAPLNLRDDIGALWENFLFMERIKYIENNFLPANHYFWRLKTGAELDLIEEQNGQITAFEFKFSKSKSKTTPPPSWQQAYPKATFQTITRDNYLAFAGVRG